MNKSNLCNVSELQAQIKDDKVKVLDASWYLPTQNRDTKKEFEQQHIIGAQFFDIDSVCDQGTDLPHMLPTAKEFSDSVSGLGISNSDDVVIYDSIGLFSAARVWWMFKVFGHDSVRVLNGGLPAWIDSGNAVNSSAKNISNGNFIATLQEDLLVDKVELIDNCQLKKFTVLDARPTARFLGQAPEPRPGLPSGHMPNSVSLPFNELIENGALKSREQLQPLFSDLGVDESSQVITSCGSGVTAAIITLALSESGFGMKRLYDGSWAEWGSAEDTIILDRSRSDYE